MPNTASQKVKINLREFPSQSWKWFQTAKSWKKFGRKLDRQKDKGS